jgi:hypothetical protein
LNKPSSKTNGSVRHIYTTANEIVLFWEGIGGFLVRDGCEIIVDPLPGVSESMVRLFILGTVLAMLLHQRGEVTVLHASVVDIAGQAAAFIGVKHAGKSTMAATLQAKGHNLVADDILAVDMRQNLPVALPGFPHFKLWPDSVAILGLDPNKLPQLRPELEKRGHRVNSGFANKPVPLKRIYILSQGIKPEIEPLDPQDALVEIMPHWYAARFGMDLLQNLGLSTHFLQCVNLVNRVKISRLKRPASMSDLPIVARLVEEHLAAETHPTKT